MTKLGVSYFGNRFLSHAKEDLAKIAGCSDYIVHTVSETDLTYHKSVLSKILNATRKLNLECWVDPWGLGGVFGGEALSKFLIEHRDSWQVMSDGRVVPSACLNRPEWRSFVKEWLLTVRDMGAQVIFWDEPHIAFDLESEWGGIYSCTCSVCKEKFKKEYGVYPEAKLNNDNRSFRRSTIKSFLDEMMSYAHAKDLKNALCLYAFRGNEEYDLVWKQASELEHLDIFGCDPYWRWHGHKDPAAHVKSYSDYVVQSASRNGKESQIWVQAMRLPSGAESEIEAACLAAQKSGVSYIAAWSYDGGEILDPVLSEKPEQVWHSLETVFKQIRGTR